MNDAGVSADPLDAVGTWRRALDAFERVLTLAPEARDRELAQLRDSQPRVYAHVLTLLEADRAASRGEFLAGDAVAALGALEAAAAAGPTLAAGQELGGYRLVRPLGTGGMGEVWLAERDLGRFVQAVALKVLRPMLTTASVRERFAREGRFLAQLSHPNIAQLHDAGVGPRGELFLALEYVDGDRIDRWCDARRLDVRGRLELFLQVCRAVAHAHGHLVVHRDLKPSNVLVTADGTAKLVDFGIAKLVASEPGSSDALTELTRLDARPMTPEFAAPEQVLGQPVTTATDVHALGALLYVLLCGRHPFGDDAASAAQVARAIVETDPPAPSQVAGGGGSSVAADRGTSTAQQLARRLRGDLDDIVAKAMRKAPAERYASALALADDVERHLRDAPVAARAGSRAYRASRYVRRHRTMLTAVALVVVATVGGLVAALWQAQVARQEARKAEAVSAFLIRIFEQNRINHPDGASSRETTAEQLLGIGAQLVGEQLADQPAAREDMLRMIGGVYEEMQLLDKAIPLYEQRIVAATEAYGPDDRRTAVAKSVLGIAFVYSGRFDDGERLLREAMPVLDRFPVEAAYERGHGRIALAFVAQRVRPLSPDADRLFGEAREIFRTYEPKESGHSQAVRGLARTREFREDFASAEQLYRESLALAESLGDKHATAGGRQTLGRVLRQQRRLREALAELDASVPLFEFAGGVEHTFTADARRERGVVLADLGDARAEADLRAAIDVLERTRGKDDAQLTALAYSDLGWLQYRRGAFTESAEWHERALAASRAQDAPGPFHEVALGRAAWLELRSGRLDGVPALLDEREAIVRERRGDAHSAAGEGLALRAELALARGAHDDARRGFETVMQRWPARAGVVPPPYVAAADGFVRAALAGGDAAAAEVVARRLRDALLALGPTAAATPFELATADLRLGESLCALARADEARPLLAAAVERRAATGVPASPWLAEARRASAACGSPPSSGRSAGRTGP